MGGPSPEALPPGAPPEFGRLPAVGHRNPLVEPVKEREGCVLARGRLWPRRSAPGRHCGLGGGRLPRPRRILRDHHHHGPRERRKRTASRGSCGAARVGGRKGHRLHGLADHRGPPAPSACPGAPPRGAAVCAAVAARVLRRARGAQLLHHRVRAAGGPRLLGLARLHRGRRHLLHGPRAAESRRVDAEAGGAAVLGVGPAGHRAARACGNLGALGGREAKRPRWPCEGPRGGGGDDG
mmetsp:Transcript_7385/g.17742  ORF Transcript_7385/g.17742 Transcript_7385/m.17742 type:complete len:238 (-) Transcript_7385:2342-3055(-)